jgi:hypothetical protein
MMFDLTWGVPSQGFSWVDVRLKGGWETEPAVKRYLTPRLAVHWREYDLRRDAPALFYEFGEVEPSHDAVLAFANAYGPLGVDSAIVLPDGTPGRGEALHVWKEEIIAMRHALRIWQALKGHREQDLRTWFHLETHGNEPRVVYTPDEPWPPDVPMETPAFSTQRSLGEQLWFTPGLMAWRRSDPSDIDNPANAVGLALAFLRRLVNDRLAIYGGVYLGYLRDTTRPVPFGLKIVTPNLLMALWLQLAAAIEGEQRYQRCPQCRHWFQVPGKARRDSTTYCSTRCRIKAFRERQGQTQEASQASAKPSTTLASATKRQPAGKPVGTTARANKWRPARKAVGTVAMVNDRRPAAKPTKPIGTMARANERQPSAKPALPVKRARKPRSSTEPHPHGESILPEQDASERSTP